MSEERLTYCEFAANELQVRLDVTVPADSEAVVALIEQVMQTVAETGCAAGREDDVRLVIDEALTNAVVHGCQEDSKKSIQCCVACDEKKGMLIVVRDPGPGFDPASIPNPIVGENLFATHGRGIFLINQFADEVRFERGGAEIHIRIK